MINFVSTDDALQQVNPILRSRLVEAQSNLLHLRFASAGDLCSQVFQDMQTTLKVPSAFYELPLSAITNRAFSWLQNFFATLLRHTNFPEDSVLLQATSMAQRLHLIQAFERPDEVLRIVEQKVTEVATKFPKKAADIERGRNPGDVLDPYILAATQYLLCGGNFEKAIEASVAHKALMMIEGLLGHLHEDVIGMMRGNVRVPEPRGEDQEKLDLISNPFPGADVIQPPLENKPVRFHQLKSKTGSAKGGDGKRLGEQLQRLQNVYNGEIYYHALIGNTLQGHRSMAGVTKAAPKVIVLVGNASFRELTGSDIGPQLLLRVYQASFTNVAFKLGYVLEDLAIKIVKEFQDRASKDGSGFLEVILNTVTEGEIYEQDSRAYRSGRNRKSPLQVPLDDL